MGDPDQLVSGETETGGAASGAQTPWGRPATSTGSMHDRLKLILAVGVLRLMRLLSSIKDAYLHTLFYVYIFFETKLGDIINGCFGVPN